MRRVTSITLVLVLSSTWLSTLVMIFLARALMPETISLYEDFGGKLPFLTQHFLPFWLEWYGYAAPLLATVGLGFIEVALPSERSRLVIQIVWTTAWLVFVILGFVALLLPCWKMSGTVGS